MKLLLIGPLPILHGGGSPLGGTSVSFHYLVEEIKQRKDIYLTVFDTDSRGFSISSVPSIVRDVIRLAFLIRRHDVIGFHASTRRFIVFGFILRILCKWWRRPCVVRVFGGSILDVYRRGGSFEKLLISAVFNADRVLIQSKEIAATFAKEFPHSKISWFPTSRPLVCGVTPRWERGTPLRFVFMSHLRPEKGVREIIEAVREIGSEGLVVEFYGGQTTDEIIREIESVPGCVYGGELEPVDVLGKLKEADVMLLPTYYPGEGYPGIVIEAFQCALPVIATNWNSIPELVVDGENGLLIPIKDSGSLAAAMTRLIADCQLYRTLSAGAYASGCFFSSERWNGQEYLRLCRESMGSP